MEDPLIKPLKAALEVVERLLRERRTGDDEWAREALHEILRHRKSPIYTDHDKHQIETILRFVNGQFLKLKTTKVTASTAEIMKNFLLLCPTESDGVLINRLMRYVRREMKDKIKVTFMAPDQWTFTRAPR